MIDSDKQKLLSMKHGEELVLGKATIYKLHNIFALFATDVYKEGIDYYGSFPEVKFYINELIHKIDFWNTEKHD